LNEHVQYDLKSAGNLLDKVGQFDFNGLSANANGLLTEVRGSNVKLKSLLQDTDNAITRAQLEKLTRDLDTLANQLQDTVARLEPGVANIDFDALNQTLANARQTIRDLDETLAQLKQYPSGFLFGKPPAPVKGVEPSGQK
jgi:ABC-type transporter Mla subunit MlaD